MGHGEYRVDEINVVPQLTSFKAVKVSFERVLLAPAPGLSSALREELSVRLEQAIKGKSETALDGPNLRIFVEIVLDSTWMKKTSEEIVANFSGKYRGLFEFKEKIDASRIQQCLKAQWYRDLLVAQVYPLAKTHMADEVRMMGINSKSPKGYDVYAGKFEPVDIPPKATLAIPKRSIGAVKKPKKTLS